MTLREIEIVARHNLDKCLTTMYSAGMASPIDREKYEDMVADTVRISLELRAKYGLPVELESIDYGNEETQWCRGEAQKAAVPTGKVQTIY